MSDIVDNRSTKLVEKINEHLSASGAAHFAVGYFFLSGFEAIAARLSDLGELRLLIGNTSNQQTVEQLAEGYRRLELVNSAIEQQVYRKRIDAEQWADETAENIRAGIAVMDQTDSAEELVKSLAQMIEEKRLKVKIYTKGRLHAKAYIFDYKTMYDNRGRPVVPPTPGAAVVGSSNLSLSGITHNTELNVVVHGEDNHTQLKAWFDVLWDEAEPFDATLMTEIQQSWVNPVRPYDIYMKTLYTLVKDRVEGDELAEILWPDEINNKLADFQKVAVRQAVQMIHDNHGAFVADVVGLGKSFVGAAIIKHFERTEHARALIICPAPLLEMWERYNEVYELNAAVVSMGELREGQGHAALLERFPNRDFVLIDESHNLRHRDTQRYRVVESFLAAGRRCCLLTASPRNKSAWDIYHQIKLFHQDDRTDLPISPPHLREFFRLVENGERNLPDLLTKILVRRTRSHVLRWYGYDSETHERVDPARYGADYENGQRRAYVMVGGRHQFFPRRELATVEYSIEQTYQGLYGNIRRTLSKSSEDASDEDQNRALTFARYGLWRYVRPEKQKVEPYVSLKRAGTNLRGLIRIMLFKRFESSVHAFRETVTRLVRVHELFLESMHVGIVPAGEQAQGILYDWLERDEAELADALAEVAGQYALEDFDVDRLLRDIEHDIHIMRDILEMVAPISPEQDVKLQTLKQRLSQAPIKGNKVLIFTQYADTAAYLFDQLNPNKLRADIEVVFSGDKNKARIVGRFSPGSNPEYRPQSGEREIITLIATDVLAEGLNLQDGNIIINYDLHWNPVRLIQRFGRIDRIGTEHDVVYGFNFLPEIELERNLGLREKLSNRIAEIHESIGEDAAILDPSEQLNPTALYAIYEAAQGDATALFDDDDEYLDLSEAEEILRQLRKDQPGEYKRVAQLRDGIRSGKTHATQSTYVFCQSGNFQQLFLADASGQILTRDIPRVLGTIQCSSEEPTLSLPSGHNQLVMQMKHLFAQEVKQRAAQREFSANLTAGQKYVLRELRDLFNFVDEDDTKAQVNVLDKAFRGSITKAVAREVNLLRRHGVRSSQLIKSLSEIYFQHNMRDWLERTGSQEENDLIPRIICSEALT